MLAPHTPKQNRLVVPPVAPPTTQSERESAGQVARRASIDNSLLAAIPRKAYRRLLAGLEPDTLTFGEVLYEPWETIRHVYFPSASLVSLLTLADGHLALEVGLIGREGMVGIPLVLGHNASSVRALLQVTGTALRMASARFHKDVRLSLPLQHELYRYTHALLDRRGLEAAACECYEVVRDMHHGAQARHGMRKMRISAAA